MNRRDLITLLGGVAVLPVAARAQQPGMPVVGLLLSGSPKQFADRVRALRQGLSETGYVDGRNMVIEFRWGEGQYDRLPTLASDLVRREVAVIVRAMRKLRIEQQAGSLTASWRSCCIAG